MPAPLHRLQTKVLVPRPLPLGQLFPFFSDPANLERLTPPWLSFKVLSRPQKAHEGQVIDYRLNVRGLPLRWRTLITRWDPPRGFVDVAIHSPYAFWHHTHAFRPLGRQTEMTDTVLFSLPFAPLGDWVAGAYVQADVEKIFAWRTQAIQRLFPAKRQ